MDPTVKAMYALMLCGALPIPFSIPSNLIPSDLKIDFVAAYEEYVEIAKYNKPWQECILPFVDRLLEKLNEKNSIGS